MSIQPNYFASVSCDSCDNSFGPLMEYPNAAEIRSAAFAEGWRFPGKNSVQGGLTPKRHSDLCPPCYAARTEK